MQSNGLRFKLTKTDAELVAEGGEPVTTRMQLGPFQMMSFTFADGILEALGFTATSNNAARQEEKRKAIAATKEKQKKYAGLQKEWLTKYGYKKFVGDWFYADQLSSDKDESSKGGFNMQKGGYYPNGMYKPSK